MEQKIKDLIASLMKENNSLTDKLRDPDMSQYNRTYVTHRYNQNIDFICRLETLIK